MAIKRGEGAVRRALPATAPGAIWPGRAGQPGPIASDRSVSPVYGFRYMAAGLTQVFFPPPLPG